MDRNKKIPKIIQQKFCDGYTEKYPCSVRLSVSAHPVQCKVCSMDISVAYSGMYDFEECHVKIEAIECVAACSIHPSKHVHYTQNPVTTLTIRLHYTQVVWRVDFLFCFCILYTLLSQWRFLPWEIRVAFPQGKPAATESRYPTLTA